MLGSAQFLSDYGVKYAYVAGAMVKGIASVQLVARMGNARLLSFYGSGGQRLEVIDAAIRDIRSRLTPGRPFGVNLLHNMLMPELEERTVEILLSHQVRAVEAAAFIEMTPALVWYRVKGLRRLPTGLIEAPHRVLGKASRLEVARRFLSPPPDDILRHLLQAGKISAEERELAHVIAMTDDLCAEGDSGGHTDRRALSTLLPSFIRLRADLSNATPCARAVRIGAAGGLGTPEAIAAAFLLGAEFVLTGSINQCTVEAGTSERVKDLLSQADTQDTEMAPAGDLFEIGSKVQVLRKGVLFPARANRLYELYRRYDSLEEIDAATRRQLEEKYFRRSIDDVWSETRKYYQGVAPGEIERAEQNPKQKMAMIFRWYFVHSNRLALAGDPNDQLDYQIHCGPAMGAFNQWAKETPFRDWRCRHVDAIAEQLMQGAAQVIQTRLESMLHRGTGDN